MFEKFSLIWKGDSPLKEQYNEFIEMLNIIRDMFHVVLETLRVGKEIEEMADMVYKTDIKINKMERNIRKHLVSHLTFNPGREIPESLVLMSIVKDAERLGDFCKNLFEATLYWNKPCGELHYCKKITEFAEYVNETFDSTIKAFETEDNILAAEIVQDEARWNKRFDGFIKELSESDISTKQAVCTTLMTRMLKRLQAHLSNIASSVIMPVHYIDYRPKNIEE